MTKEVLGLFSFLGRVFLLFFCPKIYIQVAKKRQPEAAVQAIAESASRVRRSIFRGLHIVVVTSIFTLLTYCILAHFEIRPSPNTIIVGRIIGYLTVLWGVLSPAGWSIQTWKGESLTEILDQEWHRVIYTAGLFFLLLSYLFELH